MGKVLGCLRKSLEIIEENETTMEALIDIGEYLHAGEEEARYTLRRKAASPCKRCHCKRID